MRPHQQPTPIGGINPPPPGHALRPTAPLPLRSLLRHCVGLLTACTLLSTSRAHVVINEIFYHAPDELEDLQWIELHNPDPTEVDVAGWSFSRGIEYRFPASTRIPAGGFLVLARNAKRFAEYYDIKVDGEFRRSIGRGGDTLDLVDTTGHTIDRVTFDDGAPWPTAADGVGASLERITPSVSGDRVENWSASPLPTDATRPAGTPGRRNATYSASLPPVIESARVQPESPSPGERIRVEAVVRDPNPLRSVEARYHIVQPGRVEEERVVPMQPTGGGGFAAEIPGVEEARLLRVRIRAVDRQGAERFFPSLQALAPAISVFVQAKPQPEGLPRAIVIHAEPAELAEMERVRERALRKPGNPFEPPASAQLTAQLMRSLELRRAWFEQSVNQPIDEKTYRAVRPLIAAAKAEHNKILEEVVAAKDPNSLRATATARVEAIKESLLTQCRQVLPGEAGENFAQALTKALQPAQPGPGDFLAQLFSPEGAWMALSTRFEWTDGQLRDVAAVFRTAARERGAKTSSLQQLMQGQRDFLDFLNDLGPVQSRFEKDLSGKLTAPQNRFFADWKQNQGSFIRPKLLEARPRPPRGNTAFIHVDPTSGKTEVHDFIHVTERSAGYKVHFHRDRPFQGMTAANIIFEYQDRFTLAEPLAFELYRRAGNAACRTDFVRLTLNGHAAGYHLLFEQVNGAFLRRNKLHPGGDLYKILWYGLGIEGQHEKQNHPDHDHRALTELVDRLQTTEGDAQWAVIEKNFNVDQVATYFAVNCVLSHWDGFFNNYFTFHDRRGSGKWEIYPWDQDKTWGFHDQSEGQVFFDMPLSFGMAGDRPPGGGPPLMNPGHWWRPGGYFSKPLLANPKFRDRYLQRVRQILDEVYTEKTFFPIIDAMAERLRPEVPLRAQLLGESPAEALSRLDKNVASLKEHLVKRRKFLLEQKELSARP